MIFSEAKLKKPTFTPQQTTTDEPVSTVERQKSQLAKLQAEIETVSCGQSFERISKNIFSLFEK